MNIFVSFFNTVLYQPILNITVLIYDYLPWNDFGLAIIILTILLRLALHPLMVQSLRSQKALQEIQPKLREIQEKHKEDRQKQGEEIMALYKNAKINPFSGLIPLLIQLPLMIAFFKVFNNGFTQEAMTSLYSFVPHPGVINTLFLGVINLSQSNMILAALSGVVQFFQMKTMAIQPKKTKAKDQMSKFAGTMQKQMMYFFPIFTVFLLSRLPAAIAIYWITTSLFSIVEQRIVKKHGESK